MYIILQKLYIVQAVLIKEFVNYVRNSRDVNIVIRVIYVNGISFVFPCLNEAETVKQCIDELKTTLSSRPDISYEIIVADNGSTDETAAIASAAGARVVSVGIKGYGAALKGGFAAAEFDYIAFADADGSYPLNKIPEMYDAAVKEDVDMVIASRMSGGKIEKGAMPFLHRYLGTPVLTALINILFFGKLTDCNSGFRLIKKKRYQTWTLDADGMEFASELLITALKTKSKIVEIKGGLRRDLRHRKPHLKTWHDGMRHLLFILSERPELFDCLGFFGVLLMLCLSCITLIAGPSVVGGFHIFDIHTRLLLIGSSILFVQLYQAGCYLYTASGIRPCLWVTRKVLNWDEANVFFVLLLLFLVEAAGIGIIITSWSRNDFHDLQQSDLLFALTQLLALIGSFMIGLLSNSMIRRFKKNDPL